MKEPHWVLREIVLSIHEEQLAEHGGLSGIRDEGLLESALARPLNLWSYGKGDPADLAAAYAFGIARNHPFLDGNKRTAFVAAALFLLLNGLRLEVSDADCVVTMLAVAEGSIEEEAFSEWLRLHSVPLSREPD